MRDSRVEKDIPLLLADAEERVNSSHLGGLVRGHLTSPDPLQVLEDPMGKQRASPPAQAHLSAREIGS